MKEVLVFVTDGFADWEAAYVCPELNKPGTNYRVKTVAIDKSPKTSMGGLRVLPDYEISEQSFLSEMAMLIIPGGTGWHEEKNQQARELVDYCFRHQIVVAAICDATTFLGRHGFLDERRHTGNTLEYLKQGAPEYRGEAHYIAAQAVSDDYLITANGSAAVEFSKLILEKLEVLQGEELDQWYKIFKTGYLSI
jgi:putative intracellular protease/amidase